MWTRHKGKSDGSAHDERRSKTEGSSGSSGRRRAESVVSSSTSRNPTRLEDRSDYPPTLSSRSTTYPPPPSTSSVASYATAPDRRATMEYDTRSDRTAPARFGFDDRDDDLRSTKSERRRDRSSSRDRRQGRKESDRDDRKDRKDKRDSKTGKKLEKSEKKRKSNKTDDTIVDAPGRARAGSLPTAFGGQMNSPGFTQFPGQSGAPSNGMFPQQKYDDMDAHVSHQFPGQNPSQFSAPYRPPLSAAEGGAGLAADYYGDQGESVAYQPGVRPQQPSLIVGAEPHLMAASPVAAPPAETGHGAAAEFYGGGDVNFGTSEKPPMKPPRPSSQSMPGSFEPDAPVKPPRPSPSKPSRNDKPSKIPTAAAMAGGAALGYGIGHESSSGYVNEASSTSFYQQGSTQQNGHSTYYAHPSIAHVHSTSEPSVPTVNAYNQTAEGKPVRPDKQSSSSNAGLYAAGAAGLAAGAYGLHEHHQHHQHSASLPMDAATGGPYYQTPDPSLHPSVGGMAHRHKHRGPVSKFVDWWKDYEDVRKMEEYTEYIGVCRYCFDPHTNLGDAPRKHHYHGRRSTESLRHQNRIHKDARYYHSSDSDSRRKGKSKSWVANGIAGYGLAKVGKALWWQNQDFDDTYSAKSGRRYRSSKSSVAARSRSRSRDRRSQTSYGVVRNRSRSRDGRATKSHVGHEQDYKIVRHRSKSRDRKSGGIFAAAAGAAIGAAAAGHIRSRHRSRSRSRSPPQVESVRRRGHSREREHKSGLTSSFGFDEKTRHQTSHHTVAQDPRAFVARTHRSPERTSGILGGIFASGTASEKRHKAHAKKKKGFFSFANSSSSSSESGLVYGGSELSRRTSQHSQGSQRRSGERKRRDSDDRLNKTLLGLGATAAALAAANGARDKHAKRKAEVFAVRETKGKKREHIRMPGAFAASASEEDEWEEVDDADDDSSSMNSGLAFGESPYKSTKSRKSTESLVSDTSGTAKWGWRWGSKKKRKSQDAVGAAPPPSLAAPSGMSSLSSVPTLQTVYPVQTNDPNYMDAVRRSDLGSAQAQPLITSRPDVIPLQQPQPVMPVSNSVYTTQGPTTPSYTAPSGPPVFASGPGRAPPTGFRSHEDERPTLVSRRGNSSPTLSSFKRDATIAGVAAAATAGALALGRSSSKQASSPTAVRFEETAKEARERKKTEQREQERSERERKLRDEEEARLREHERLERIEAETRLEELRQREKAERLAEAKREAEEAEAKARAKQREAENQAYLDRETERIRKERESAARVAAERERIARDEADRLQRAHEEKTRERERLEREIAEANRVESEWRLAESKRQEREEKLDYDIESRHRELRERERDIVEPDSWKGPVAAGAAAGVVAAGLSKLAKGKSSQADSYAKDQYDDDRGLYDDPVYDPNYIKNKGSGKEADIARRAASKVIADLEQRYKEPPKDMAEFFTPKELLDRTSYAQKIGPNGDADVQVYNAPHIVTMEPPRGPPYEPPYSFTATKDGYDPSRNFAPYPVPTLNVIGPTPPASMAGSVKGDKSIPPSPVMEPLEEAKAEEPPTEQSEKRRKRSSVTWGADETFHYDAQTPESFREHFMSQQDMDKQMPRRGHEDEFVIEHDDPRSGRHQTTYQPEQRSYQPEQRFAEDRGRSSSSYSPDMESPITEEIRRFGDDVKVYEAHSPEREPIVHPPSEERAQKFYQTPFFETVSDFGVPEGVASPRGQHGFVEEIVGEPEEIPSMPSEARHESMPGGFVEDEETQPEPAWEPKLSKKEQKKRDKAVKRQSSDSQAGADLSPVATETPMQSTPERVPEPEPAWEAPLSKKEQKKREKASKRASQDADPLSESMPNLTRGAEPFDERTRETEPEPAWEAPLSKKDQKKRDKAAKRASQEPESPAEFAPSNAKEIEPVQTATFDDWEPKLSKKEQKKRDKEAKRQSLESSVESVHDREPPATDPWADTENFADPNISRRNSDHDFADIESGQPGFPPLERVSSRDARSDYGVPLSRSTENGKPEKESRHRSFDAAPLGFAAAAGILAGAVADSKKKEKDPEKLARTLSYPNDDRERGREVPGAFPFPDVPGDRSKVIPSTAFDDVEELADAKKPTSKKSKRKSGRFSSPSPGSPLSREVSYDDYIGVPVAPMPPVADRSAGLTRAPNETASAAEVPLPSEGSRSPEEVTSPDEIRRKKTYVYDEPEDTGAPAGVSIMEPKNSRHYEHEDSARYSTRQKDPSPKSSDSGREGISSRSTENDEERRKHRHHRRRVSDDPYSKDRDLDSKSVASDERYDEEARRHKRHHRRRESERSDAQDDSKSVASEDRYDEQGHRKHKHRKHRSGDDDSKSVASEFRDDEEDERRKHKHRKSRRESDLIESPNRGAPASEPGDLYESSHKHRRRSKKDGDLDETASVVSSPAKYHDDDSKSKKDKEEKKKGGLFGLFGRSTTSVTDPKERSHSRDSRAHDSRAEPDDDERKHRKKKHRSSTHGSTYGSDDETRSVVSSSSRREKRSSRDDEGMDTRHKVYTSLPLTPHRDGSSPEPADDEHLLRNNRFKDTAVDDQQSFLGLRARGPDAAAADASAALPPLPINIPAAFLNYDENDALPSFTALPPSRSSSPVEVGRAMDLPALPHSRPASPDWGGSEVSHHSTPSRLSTRAHSTTAIPLRFRRPPVSPRVASTSQVETTTPQSTPTFSRSAVTSPTSPQEFATPVPRSRHSKSPSTEFKTSTEFRPLYLVERNSRLKTPEVEDQLPSLPSSRTTSRSASVHNEDHARSEMEEDWASANEWRSADQSPEASLSGRTESWADAWEKSAVREDLLSSGQTTPKAMKSSPILRNQDEVAPSLPESGAQRSLEDTVDAQSLPALPSSRSTSPNSKSEFRNAALAALMGGAAIAAHEVLDRRDEHRAEPNSERNDQTRSDNYIKQLPQSAPHEQHDPFDDFMGGEPDENAIEEARLAAEAVNRIEAVPASPTRPSLSRTSSKKSKKGKKAAKLGTTSVTTDTPEQMSPEEVRRGKEADTQSAIDSWWTDEPAISPVAANDDAEAASAPEEPAAAEQGASQSREGIDSLPAISTIPEVPSVLLSRNNSKAKKKKGKKSKSGSISEPSGTSSPKQEPAASASTPVDGGMADEKSLAFLDDAAAVSLPEEDNAAFTSPDADRNTSTDQSRYHFDDATAVPLPIAEEDEVRDLGPHNTDKQEVGGVNLENANSDPSQLSKQEPIPVEASFATQTEEVAPAPILAEPDAPSSGSGKKKKKEKGKKSKRSSTSSPPEDQPIIDEPQPPQSAGRSGEPELEDTVARFAEQALPKAEDVSIPETPFEEAPLRAVEVLPEEVSVPEAPHEDNSSSIRQIADPDPNHTNDSSSTPVDAISSGKKGKISTPLVHVTTATQSPDAEGTPATWAENPASIQSTAPEDPMQTSAEAMPEDDSPFPVKKGKGKGKGKKKRQSVDLWTEVEAEAASKGAILDAQDDVQDDASAVTLPQGDEWILEDNSSAAQVGNYEQDVAAAVPVPEVDEGLAETVELPSDEAKDEQDAAAAVPVPESDDGLLEAEKSSEDGKVEHVEMQRPADPSQIPLPEERGGDATGSNEQSLPEDLTPASREPQDAEPVSALPVVSETNKLGEASEPWETNTKKKKGKGKKGKKSKSADTSEPSTPLAPEPADSARSNELETEDLTHAPAPEASTELGEDALASGEVPKATMSSLGLVDNEIDRPTNPEAITVEDPDAFSSSGIHEHERSAEQTESPPNESQSGMNMASTLAAGIGAGILGAIGLGKMEEEKAEADPDASAATGPEASEEAPPIPTKSQAFEEIPIPTDRPITSQPAVSEEPAVAGDSIATEAPLVSEEPTVSAAHEEEVEPEQEWALRGKKNNKKKKRTSLLSTPAEESAAESTEPAPVPELAEDGSSQPLQPSNDEVTHGVEPESRETRPLVEEWALPAKKKSKKDKKRGSKSATPGQLSRAASPSVAAAVEEGPAAALTEDQSSTRFEPLDTHPDRPDHPVPESEQALSLAGDIRPGQTEQLPEDEWAMPPKKNKGKKGKRQESTLASSEEPSQVEVTSQDTAQEVVEPKDVSADVPSTEASLEGPLTQEPEPVQAEDEWSAPAKKGKKGKKGKKQASLSETPNPVPAEVAPLPKSNIEQQPEASVEDPAATTSAPSDGALDDALAPKDVSVSEIPLEQPPEESSKDSETVKLASEETNLVPENVPIPEAPLDQPSEAPSTPGLPDETPLPETFADPEKVPIHETPLEQRSEPANVDFRVGEPSRQTDAAPQAEPDTAKDPEEGAEEEWAPPSSKKKNKGKKGKKDSNSGPSSTTAEMAPEVPIESVVDEQPQSIELKSQDVSIPASEQDFVDTSNQENTPEVSPEATAEDVWEAPVKKKSKKGKKGNNSGQDSISEGPAATDGIQAVRQASVEDQEPSAGTRELENSDPARPAAESGPSEEVVTDAPEPTQLERDSESNHGTTAPVPPKEPSWSSLSGKKKKDAKKKYDKALRDYEEELAAFEAEQEAEKSKQEEANQPEAGASEEKSATADDLGSVSVQNEVPPEVTEKTEPEQAEAQPLVESEQNQDLTRVVDNGEPEQPEEPSQSGTEKPTALERTEQTAEEAPVADLTSEEQPAVEAGEDEWVLPSVSKKKKGKKGKKSMSASFEDATPPLDLDKDRRSEEHQPIERSHEEPQAPEVVLAQDQPAKGLLEDSLPAETEKITVEPLAGAKITPKAPTPNDDVPVSEPSVPEAPREEVVEDIWEPPVSKKRVKKGKKGSVSSPAPEPTLDLEDAVVEETPQSVAEAPVPEVSEEQAAEDAWEAPSSRKKKGKKGKKGGISSPVPNSAPEPEESSIEEALQPIADSQPALVEQMTAPEGESTIPDDVISQTPQDQVVELPPESIETMNNDAGLVEPQEEGAVSSEVPIASEPQEVDPFQEFASEKKSKKDKKKAKKSKTLSSEEPIAPESSAEDNSTFARVDEPDTSRELDTTNASQPKQSREPLESESGQPSDVTLDNSNSVPAEDTPLPTELPADEKPATEGFGFTTSKAKKAKGEATESPAEPADPVIGTSEPASFPAEEPKAVDTEPKEDTDLEPVTVQINKPTDDFAADPHVVDDEPTVPRDPDPQGEPEFAAFATKKSKKDKKRKKGKISSTPDTPLESQTPPVEATDETERFHAPEAPASAEAAIEATKLPEISAESTTAPTRDLDPEERASDNNGEAVDQPTETELAPQPEDQTKKERVASPVHDVEFAAALAAGLQDSGFNPNLVLEDPSFHQRRSPPGSAVGADPDDVFTASRPKKSKKGKKNRSASAVDAPEGEVLPEPGSESQQSQAFGKEPGSPHKLAEYSAFDPTSVLNDPVFHRMSPRGSHEAISDEFFPFQARKKKGKKSRNSMEDLKGQSSDARDLNTSEEPANAQQDTSAGGFEHGSTQGVDPPVEQRGLDNDAHEAMSPAIMARPTEEDEWAMPTKKSGKRAKKGKKKTEEAAGDAASGLAAEAPIDMDPVEAPVTEAAAAEAVALPEESPRELPVEAIDHLEGTKDAKNIADKTGNRLIEDQDFKPEQPADDEFTWAAPSENTKGKKGKQGVEQRDTCAQPYTPIESQVDVASFMEQPGQTIALASWADEMEGTQQTNDKAPPGIGGYFDQPVLGVPRQEPKPLSEDSTPQPAQVQETSPPEDVNSPIGASPVPEDSAKEEHHPSTGTSAQSSKLATLFPGLERVKRRAPSQTKQEVHPTESIPTREDWSWMNHGAQQSQARKASPIETAKSQQQKTHPPVTSSEASAPITVLGPTWTFPPDRDSAVHVSDSPMLTSAPSFHEVARDSGYHDNEIARESEEPNITHSELPMARIETALPEASPTLPESGVAEEGTTLRSPVESLTTTKQRSSQLFQSSPSSGSVQVTPVRKYAEGTPGTTRSIETVPSPPTAPANEQEGSIFGDPTQKNTDDAAEDITPLRHMRSPSVPLNTIPEHSPEYSPQESPLSKKGRQISDIGEPEHALKALRRSHTPMQDKRENYLRSPPPYQGQREVVGREHSFSPAGRKLGDPFVRRGSAQSGVSDTSGIGRHKTPEHFRPHSSASNRSATPPLRRVDRSLSGDLRSASRLSEDRAHAKTRTTTTPQPSNAQAEPSTSDRIKERGIARAVMADELEGWGDAHGTPLSPTRPPSVRKRQSMHIMDLETRLDQLSSENRLLQEAKARAEEQMQDANFNRDVGDGQIAEAVEARDLQIREKDEEIARIRDMIHNLNQDISRLSEANASLTLANKNLTADTNQRYATLQAESQEAYDQWQQSAKQLEELRQQHSTLAAGMEETVRHEIALHLQDKDTEIHRLKAELANATEQVKALQAQILSTKQQGESFLTIRDEDYFDSACQQLCQHVQQWVLRFSKFSDTRACRLSSDIRDEKIEARLDNAVLDGSDVDMLLADRVRRRDVFMSVVMTMVWEYVFTRYLFGMDREQRQKLKALEKTLTEVGPQRAVAQWRAITLTLLSKREPFLAQRAQDTEAVVQEIHNTLATLLPPPPHLEAKIIDSLRGVMRLAVNLSIEMRTQRAEYIMLPPLQPEYDTNGDLLRKVHFNASLMNERSGETSSNEDLEAKSAVVKMVLFPLVVKKGDDLGEGEDEIVVCPAQVLVAKSRENRKVVRVLSGAMEIDRRSQGSRGSRRSLLPESMLMGGGGGGDVDMLDHRI